MIPTWNAQTTNVIVYLHCTDEGAVENSSLGTLQKVQKHGIEPIVILNRPPRGQSIELPGKVKALYAPDEDISSSFLTREISLIRHVLDALISEETTLLVFAPDNTSTDLAAMVAVGCEGAVIAGVQDLKFAGGELLLRKFVLGGTWQTNSSPQSRFAAITLHARADTTEASTSMSVSVIPVPNGQAGPEIIDRKTLPASARPELDEAAVVVTGGRGTNGDFGSVEELADELDGAVGATRDAVDEGWADYSIQVGQTGKTVSPQVYVAAGVSGAIHQRVGMDTAANIIAVNADEDAPIFEIATIGIVADLEDVLPQLTQKIRERKNT